MDKVKVYIDEIIDFALRYALRKNDFLGLLIFRLALGRFHEPWFELWIEESHEREACRVRTRDLLVLQ